MVYVWIKNKLSTMKFILSTCCSQFVNSTQIRRYSNVCSFAIVLGKTDLGNH